MTRAEPTGTALPEREADHRFRVHGLFHLPDLHQVPGVHVVEDRGSAELESTYFDTDDLRLIREGVTIQRSVGDDRGWRLRLPGEVSGTSTRNEIRAHAPVTDDQPPDELLRIVRAVIRGSPVRHICTLRTYRSTQLLLNAKGKPIAELVDDSVHVLTEDGTVTARFRELRLEERKSGKTVERVAAALTGAGAVGGEFVAKVVRALGPAATSPPEVPEPAALGPDDPAGATVMAYLAIQVRALRASDLAFRLAPESGKDAVHRMRVAARRLRGGLSTFQPLLDSRRSSPLASELTWFAHGLNDLREYDVLGARLSAHSAHLPEEVPDVPVREFLEAALTSEAARSRADAVRILNSSRYLRLHDELVTAVGRPWLDREASAPARDALPGLVHKAWKRLRASADALREDDPARNWHRVRLQAKRARYAAEAVAISLGDDAQAFAREMRKLTEILGEHQDAHQAIDVLHRLARQQPADPEIVFALGALTTVEQEHALRARARFADAWSRARRISAPRTWKPS